MMKQALLYLLVLSFALANHSDDDDDDFAQRKLLLFTLDSTDVVSVLDTNFTALYEMGLTTAQVNSFHQDAANYYFARTGVDLRGISPVEVDLGGGIVGPAIFGNGGYAIFSRFVTTKYRLEASNNIHNLHVPSSFTPFIKSTPHWILFVNPGFTYNGTYTAEANSPISGPNDNWSYGYFRVQLRNHPHPNNILNIHYRSYGPSVVDQPGLALSERNMTRIAERVSLFNDRLGGEGVGSIDISFNNRGYWKIRTLMIFPNSYLLP